MVGIEGMKDGSQPARDRPVISQSTALTLVSASLREREEEHDDNNNNNNEAKNTIKVICCSYFHRRAMDNTSTDTSPKLCEK